MHVRTTCPRKPLFSTTPAHGGVIPQISPPPTFYWCKWPTPKGRSCTYMHGQIMHSCMIVSKTAVFYSKLSSWGWDFSNLTKTPQLLPSSNWPKPNTFRESYRSFIWRINRVKEMVETCPWLHSAYSIPPRLIFRKGFIRLLRKGWLSKLIKPTFTSFLT